MWKRWQPASLRGEELEARHLLALDSLMITEFMAANETVLADEDGDFSDWIEIHNPTDQSVSLLGWTLTDDEAEPNKWPFPVGSLAAHDYLLVFASGKDRRGLDAPLHTNFRLDAGGEFLGLVDPSGTIVSPFGEIYPPQRSDVSFGVPIAQQALVTNDAAARWYVPQPIDESSGTRWTTPDFDDSQWSTSNGAVGYDLRAGYPNVGFEAADLTDWSGSGEVRAVTAATGATPSQGTWQASLMANANSVTRFSLETFLGLSRSALNRVGNVSATRGSAIKRTLVVEAGTTIELDWNFLTDEPYVNGSEDFGFVSISPGDQVIKLASVTDATRPSDTSLDRETGYQTFQYTFAEAGEYTLGVGVINDANQFVDSSLFVDNLLIDGIGSLEDTFNSIIQTPVDEALARVDSSLWLRQPFSISDLAGIESLQVRLRYDDGVALYVNGQLVEQDNVPADLRWNSVAPTDRDDLQASAYDVVTLDTNYLQSGENLFAVQTLKSAVDDENLLVQIDATALGEIGTVPVFFERSTPGLANVTDSYDVAEQVQFSDPHGLYDQAFELELTTPTVGAEIRYTLDGSTPTRLNSMPYEGSIRIDQTQTVRAVAFRDGLRPSRPTTQSYLFIEDVLTQDRNLALSRGFPEVWSQDIVADYEMDRRVIGQNGTDLFDGVYAATVRDDLKSLPTLSLVMDNGDLFGAQGIYSHPFERGVEWERPTSLELIYPDGREGFQIDAGLRIQGGISRFISSKLSLRLLFKDDYGPSKLVFPLFGPNAGQTFDSISLRSSSGEHLAGVGIHFIRDEFVRRSQLMTGNVASHGTYMHLYINGLYWGLYNPTERIDGQFAANYFGGEKTDYDVLNAGDLGNEGISAVEGSLDAWNRLVQLAGDVSAARTQEEKTAAYLRLQGLNPDGAHNPEWESYLDVDNYIDYLITQVYARNYDWPRRNYDIVRRRGLDSTGFKFYVWDAEFTLDAGSRESITDVTRDGPGILFRLLDTSEAFHVAFSDRVQLHFSPGGAYYVNPENRVWDPNHPEDNVPAALYAGTADTVVAALGPESARWGDEQARSGRLFIRDTEWAQTVDLNLREFFPNRSRDFLADLRRNEYYRDAPRVSVPGGMIMAGQVIEIQPQTGAVYYTVDGTDPRDPDGSQAASALTYEVPLVIDARTTLQIRSLDGTEWSALQSVTYYTDAAPASPDSLRFAELNYNPHDPLTAVGEANLDNDEFEFIEIANVTQRTVDLRGVRLARIDNQGVEFTFGTQWLPPGERIVVPRNRTALMSRYGTALPLAVGVDSDADQWVYQGRLGNGGEMLTLLAADGQPIQRLSYADQAGWPTRADGGGSSLEVVDLTADLNDPNNYRASRAVGGSPGTVGQPATRDIAINEVLANPAIGGLDQIEIFNASPMTVDLSGWYLSDSDNDLWQFQVANNTRLPAGGYLAFDERQIGYGLSGAQGDDVYLISVDATGRPQQFVDVVHFDATDAEVSLGRWPDGEGLLFPMQSVTIGRQNSGPLLGDALISEIHFHPRDPDANGPLTERDFEYVEVYNRTDQPLDLSGWRIADDTGATIFAVPAKTVLEAQEVVVIVGFDPVINPTLRGAFALTFSQSPDVLVVGPLAATLADQGGTVRLEKPGVPSAAPEDAAWVLVDRVTYDDQSPWPSDVHANGQSLQRVSELAFADMASSWISARANPGQVRFFVTRPGDVTGDGRIDIADVDQLCAAVCAADSASNWDVNQDGQVDLQDFDRLVRDILQSPLGDANLDGVFNSADLVAVFTAAEYEDDVPGNSTWAEGDWNCDGDFTTGDIVRAFLSGGYMAASRAMDAAYRDVPKLAATAAAHHAVVAIFVDPGRRERPNFVGHSSRKWTTAFAQQRRQPYVVDLSSQRTLRSKRIDDPTDNVRARELDRETLIIER